MAMYASTPTSKMASASTSAAAQSPDAFDAIVQAAHPLHPNHAAWVEKFGTVSHRRAGSKAADAGRLEDDVDYEDKPLPPASPLHRSNSSSGTRRRRASTVGVKSGRTSSPMRRQEDATTAATYGRAHSRAHTSAVDQTRPSFDGRSPNQDGTSPRRKTKSKRDKGKSKPKAPPIPPPRSTSHGLYPSLVPANDSPATSQPVYTSSTPSAYYAHPTATPMTASSSAAIMSFPPVSYATPPPSYHVGSSTHSHSRMTSQGDSPSIRTVSSTASPVSRRTEPAPIRRKGSSSRFLRMASGSDAVRDQSKEGKHPPTRMSSILTKAGEGNAEQRMAQLASTDANAARTIDFAFPGESTEARSRASPEAGPVRKSLDLLVSPFRSNKKSTTKGTPSASSNGKGVSATPPILREPSVDLLQRPRIPGSFSAYPEYPTASTSYRTNEVQSISHQPAEERSHRDLEAQREQSMQLERAFPTVASVTKPSSAIPRQQSLSDAEDFFDAESDEGDNGSSFEKDKHPFIANKRTSQNSQATVTKKKGRRRRSEESRRAAKAKTKAAASGLVSGSASPLPSRVRATESCRSMIELGSSASEAERAGKGSQGKPHMADEDMLHAAPQRTASRGQMSDLPQISTKAPSYTSPPLPALPVHDRYDGAIQVINRSNGQLLARGPIQRDMPQDDVASSAHSFPTTSFSGHSLSQSHDAPSASTSPSVIPASSTLTPDRQLISDWEKNKSLARSNNRGIAGVMARMRRDRTPSANAAIQGREKDDVDGLDPWATHDGTLTHRPSNGNLTSSPLGLGIATPGNDNQEASTRNWRSRLVSFSSKSNKSLRGEEQDEWRKDYFGEPMPYMPPKAKRMLLQEKTSQGKESVDLDHIRLRQMKETPAKKSISIDRIAHTSPMESREFAAKKSLDGRELLSATIHKSLSPAMLKQHGTHEADEAASFIGSEPDLDGENRRTTWNSIGNTFELPLNQTYDNMVTVPSSIVGVRVTRPSMDDRGARPSDLIQASATDCITPPRQSMTMRRFSREKGQMRTMASMGALKKSPPAALDFSPSSNGLSPAGMRSRPSFSTDDRGQERSRRPSMPTQDSSATPSRNGLIVSTPDMGRTSNIFALDRDRSPIGYQSATSPFISPTAPSPGLGKRLFSSSKGKTKSKGISSKDLADPIHLTSPSETYLPPRMSSSGPRPSIGAYSVNTTSSSTANTPARSHFHQTTREEENENLMKRQSDHIEMMQDEFAKAQEATKLLAFQVDNMAITPTSSHTMSSRPSTPNGLGGNAHTRRISEEDSNAFDRMLRESAREDAARVKQIASRTALAYKSSS